jgi:predicted DNA-binding protein (MmcQ/YjbR family)
MYINKEKLGAESKKVEVMNVKLPQEMIESLLKRKEFYKAYHMNKKYWITFILDESLSDEEIVKLIEISHSYTVKNN